VISGGAGTDVIYSDNAGNKTAWATANIDNTTSAATGATTVTIAFAGVSTGAITVAKAGANPTTAELVAGVKAAVAGDAVLSKLIAVTGTSPALVFTSLVDGTYATAPTVTFASAGGAATYAAGAATAGTAGTVAVDTVDGGAGADVIVGGGGTDTLTSGAGADTFFFWKSHSNQAALATITDYTYAVGGASNDKIILGDVAAAAGTKTTVQDLSSSATLAAAFNAAALSNTVDNGLVVFVYGGDTYVMVETTGATSDYVAGDFAVKLVGTPVAAGTALAGLGFDAV